jgi:hypothetical protein
MNPHLQHWPLDEQPAGVKEDGMGGGGNFLRVYDQFGRSSLRNLYTIF